MCDAAHARAELKSQGLDGFIIGRGDEHQGEYVPQRADRLAWISGFNGSAGAAIVMNDPVNPGAAVFVDGAAFMFLTSHSADGRARIHHNSRGPMAVLHALRIALPKWRTRFGAAWAFCKRRQSLSRRPAWRFMHLWPPAHLRMTPG